MQDMEPLNCFTLFSKSPQQHAQLPVQRIDHAMFLSVKTDQSTLLPKGLEHPERPGDPYPIFTGEAATTSTLRATPAKSWWPRLACDTPHCRRPCSWDRTSRKLSVTLAGSRAPASGRCRTRRCASSLNVDHLQQSVWHSQAPLISLCYQNLLRLGMHQGV